ncbi:MAG: ribosome small subunit-dependent GTPase A, partial [Bryobacteraceae bacterium]|nr:ribosome small subunit-dependent GTPase A [Bryobacteraceae bacterium]
AERLAAEVHRRTGTEVAPISAANGAGLEQFDSLVRPRETAVLLGSSGAGKSTLINALLESQQQPTAQVREGGCRGRHTTTSRELFLLPAGWMLIDTPGLREVEAWDAAGAVDEVFDEITALAAGCRFSDCRHRDEPGCAVRQAEADGEIEPDRLEHFLKLTAETSAQETRRQGRIGARAIRQFNKMRERRWSSE